MVFVIRLCMKDLITWSQPIAEKNFGLPIPSSFKICCQTVTGLTAVRQDIRAIF